MLNNFLEFSPIRSPMLGKSDSSEAMLIFPENDLDVVLKNVENVRYTTEIQIPFPIGNAEHFWPESNDTLNFKNSCNQVRENFGKNSADELKREPENQRI